jgi:hypothetical protein
MYYARALAACALVATLVLLTSDGVQSQDKKDTKVKGQLPTGWSKLNLSASQKEDVYKLNKEYKEKVDKLNAEIKQLNEELARKRVAILTDEQRKKLIDLVAGGEPKAKEKSKTKDPDK